MRPRPAQVLIVGAGPTGLTLATILAQYGVDVRIVEKRPELSIHTKATNLMQRSQELLASIGVVDTITELSGRMSRLVVDAYGRNVGPRTMHLPESPYPDVLLCGQHVVERVIADRLGELGVSIEFGTELTGLTQDDDSVTAALRTVSGEEEVVVDYVVGADGGTGPTRTFTALDFVPARTGVAIRQVDCTLTWNRSPTLDQMWLFYFDRGFAAIVPLPEQVHRVLLIEPVDRMPARQPTLLEMQTRLREVTRDPGVALTEQRWASYTDLAMGLAPALVDRRVILAGDSGNPVLPNGGQGMNTGIADAFNLGWKLACVILHNAPVELIESYNEERRALRRTLQKTQYNSLKYSTLSTPGVMRAAFRALAEPVLNHGGEQRIARAFSELGVNTRSSSLNLSKGRRRSLRVGDRAPDATVVRDGLDTTIHAILAAGTFTLLHFTGSTTTTSPDLDTRLAHVPTYRVARGPDAPGGRAEVLWDLDGQAHRRYDITTPTLVLIRPDGHLVARVPATDIGRIHSWFDTWTPHGVLTATTASRPTPT